MRTDLISERIEVAQLNLVTPQEEIIIDGILKTTTTVTKEEAECLKLNEGTFMTMSHPLLRYGDDEVTTSMTRVLTESLRQLMELTSLQASNKWLVVGLGNRLVTADAVGPETVDRFIVVPQRHIAITPGVMGMTGMETSDIVKTIVVSQRVEGVIVVDALAARALHRLQTTIQATTAGIHPGSGVGAGRKAISQRELGVPVIAIGIPTVVDAATIAVNVLEYVVKTLAYEMKEKQRAAAKLVTAMSREFTAVHETNVTEQQRRRWLGLLGELSDEEQTILLRDTLLPLGQQLVVTAQNADYFITQVSTLLGKALNDLLHE